ncbi:MAG: hypothetical protein ACLQU1_15620 [Bryobacteraceae bacterium]
MPERLEQFAGQGYRLSVVYLKLFENLYAPLTAGVMRPCSKDRLLPLHRTAALDQLYLAVKQALDNLIQEIGLEVAA